MLLKANQLRCATWSMAAWFGPCGTLQPRMNFRTRTAESVTCVDQLEWHRFVGRFWELKKAEGVLPALLIGIAFRYSGSLPRRN